MNQDYPELQQFLAGYFNPDWVDDHAIADDVIDFFISETSAETLAKVQKELEKLILTDKAEQELQEYLFTEIGCGYYYPNEWQDGKTWLRHIASTLMKAQQQSEL
ncbi:contact-dependent growth inhibition system immunity protein [Pseudomonas sp. S09G 359]|jgi:exonuclease VII small subunit|uniref:contact-dependent growth inhibition system immunity protein n=1 Tax=Pseudomonas sp. S09G 359 TaxID=2054919 RepID=UPI000C6E9232|nr:contact-dependent growth inhibition system immunity protein [Pseudomonas sp. S09G 359]AUG08671.1 hypothetical protein CXQ82_19545 [Pseudomonas sp. S09G 359]